jgi:dienelactone hydrolase
MRSKIHRRFAFFLHRPEWLLLFLLAVGFARPASAQPASVGPDPANDLPWVGEFPPRGPLAIEWLPELPPEEGIAMRPLRYNGAPWAGKPQRIYAIFAQPAGAGPFPALLLIHGGGQTPTPSNLAYFVKRGYACLAFDWSGLRDGRQPAEVTVWPAAVQDSHFGTLLQHGRDGLLYQATAAALRGIDVLVEQPRIDRERIGVQGVSWGGYLTWLVNGLDPRLKAAVATYGTGHLIDQWNEMRDDLRRRTPPERALILGRLDPPAFAARQQSPIMFVSGTNDFFGQLPQAEKLLAAVTADHRRSYAPNRMHGLDPQTARAAMAWFDAHLKTKTAFPAEPQLSLAVGTDGRPTARVKVDASRPITAVRVDYARGGAHALLNCWLRADAQRNSDGSFTAALPVVDVMQPLEAIAQVTYAGDFTLSSAVATAVPGMDLPGARATAQTSDTLSAWGAGPEGWLIQRGVDFIHTERPAAALENGTLDGHAALIYRTSETLGEVRLATRLPADAARNKGNRRQLEVWTHDLRNVRFQYNWFLRAPGSRELEAVSAGGPGWQRHLIRLDALKPSKDAAPSSAEPPATWNELRQLAIVGEATAQGTPAVGLIRWTDETK